MSKTAVLAYSGGLDTSCAIAWLQEDYGFHEVIAVLVDVGQQADFEPAFERGYAAGASEVLLVDRKDDFAEEQVAKAIQTNALYEGKYPLVSALARPLIAAEVVRLAREAAGEDGAVVLCTHGDVIPTLLDTLARTDGLELREDYPCAKGSTWRLVPDGSGRFRTAEYLRAPE